jgi:formylmethanofuran dehydrogenase subunit E
MRPKHSSLAAAARFHGHLGPWLALGLKAGLRARRELGASPFELTACVFCPARTPYSCFIDGVQVGSGCTLGKGNVRHVRASACRVEFLRDGSRSSRLVYRLRPEVWAELHGDKANGWAAADRLGRILYRRRFDVLFTISRSSLK